MIQKYSETLMENQVIAHRGMKLPISRVDLEE